MAKFVGQPKPSKATAICRNYKHSGYLSLRNMKLHQCESRECKYFEPILSHPYWEEKAKKKLDKKIKKNAEIIKYSDNETVAELIAGLLIKGEEE